MTTGAVAPQRSQVTEGHESFWHLVHAEWTKFRTVRGWVIAVLVTIVAITAFVFVSTDVSSGCTAVQGASSAATAVACPAQPTGPGGDPVQDVFYFAHQPVTGNGTITVQMTSLTGQTPVAPAGSRTRWGPGGPWPAAVVQGRDHHQGEHVAGLGVRGDDGHRVQRRADAMGLRQRHARPGRPRVRVLAALAAAGPRRRDDHRVRLR